MCEYFSCIVTKDGKVHWSKKTFEHEDLISQLKLEDTKLKDRDLVRIEITNKKKPPTRNPQDWSFKVDEITTVPRWFTEHEKEIENECWKAWSDSVKLNLALNAESVSVSDCYIIARDQSTVVARDQSRVEAWDQSTVEIKSRMAVIFCQDKICVLESSIVVRTSLVKASET